MDPWKGGGGGRKKNPKKPPQPVAPPRSQYSIVAHHEAIILKSLKPESISEHSLKYLVDKLKDEFPDKGAQLGVCNSIILMLQSPSVLQNRGQKVGAVALLLGLQRKENKLDYLEDNPFALVLHSLLLGKRENPAAEMDPDQPSPRTNYLPLNHVEKVILAHLTLDTENSQQMWTKCFAEVLKGGELLAKQPMPDLTRLKLIHEKEMKTLCASGLNLDFDVPFLRSSESPDMDNLSSSGSNDSIEIPATIRNFVPDFITLSPPNQNSLAQFDFMLPTVPSIQQLILQTDIEPSQEEAESRQLFNKALEDPLTSNQRHTLFNAIQTQPRVIFSLGLTPANFPNLVENNPLVAIEILLHLINKNRDVGEYLDVLVQMSVSVNSMEVVNRLTSSVELPKAFLHLFISNCIQSCEAIQVKYYQNRLARLVCVFLEALLRNTLIETQVRTILSQDLYFEIMSFCLEYSRIREAAGLYRHIKQFEGDKDGHFHEGMLHRLQNFSLESDSMSSHAQDPDPSNSNSNYQ